MEFPNLVILVLVAVIVALVQFFFLRAIIISAMKQVFIDLQNANAAIRVVNVDNARPLTNDADAQAQPQSGPTVRTEKVLVTSSGKTFQRKPTE